MENNKVPTAEEVYLEHIGSYYTDYYQIVAMKEFAKLHVQAALETAYKNAELVEFKKFTNTEQVCWIENDMGIAYVLDRDSVLDAYPDTLIK